MNIAHYMIYNKIWAWKSRNQDSYTKTAVIECALGPQKEESERKGKNNRKDLMRGSRQVS